MAISSNATGLRPGVCTSTTRPGSPYNGQVIYETDTKQTLVWQGSAWVMLTDADTPPGLELIKSVSVGSGVTSISVTSVFSATYDVYVIEISGMNSNVDGYGLKIKFNNTSGSTYYFAGVYMTVGSSTVTGFNDNGTSDGAFVCFSSGASATSASVQVFNPYAATNTTWTFQSTANVYPSNGAGVDRNAVSHTGFTLNSYSGATMTGGTIRVYGYRNTI